MIQKPTEFAVNSYAAHMAIVQLDELTTPTITKAFNTANPCHIYVIGSRPRISIDLANTAVFDELIHLSFKVWKEDEYTSFSISKRNEFNPKDVTIDAVYPYNKVNFRSGKDVTPAKTAHMVETLAKGMLPRPEFIDLDVLYVGQSYGVDGARTAVDRLKSHDTLQKIYAAACQNNPDQEIWLMLFSFKQVGITKFDGITNFTAAQRKGDKKRAGDFLKKMNNGGITEKQFINFTEAAMIRYFQPPYNDIYKDSFPNPAHTSYKECYDLDVNTINVELGTLDAINVMLYSKTVPRSYHHHANFILHNRQERVDMFNFSRNDRA